MAVLAALQGPTGLGTSGARVRVTPRTLGLQRIRDHSHVLFKPVGPTTLPEFYMPFKARGEQQPRAVAALLRRLVAGDGGSSCRCPA